jgi:hypothetical protein
MAAPASAIVIPVTSSACMLLLLAGTIMDAPSTASPSARLIRLSHQTAIVAE